MFLGGSSVGRRIFTPVLAMSEPFSTAARPVGDILSVAPMLVWTGKRFYPRLCGVTAWFVMRAVVWTPDHHYRHMMRFITRKTKLFTEMVVDNTIRYTGELDKCLYFRREQHPIALQVGGSSPESLAKAISMAAPYGYDEINLNCGCPSNRVAVRVGERWLFQRFCGSL